MSRRRTKKLINMPIAINDMNMDYLDEHAYDNSTTKYNKKKVKRKIEPLAAQTETQEEYIRAIIEYPQVVVCGSAGTGKSYIAVRMALQMLEDGEIEKIILTRPNISMSKSLGFFKGSMEEKLAPWAVPFTDIMKEVLGDGHFDYLVKSNVIDIVPFEVIRGRTFNNSFVILDEAQNLTISEIKCFVTRIGKKSKVVMNGDIKQKDIKESSGLAHLIYLVDKYDIDVPVIEFTRFDIVRSDVCAAWVTAFELEDEKSA